MTKKGATFNWTKECDAAFKLLKEKLMEDLVLISPQVDKDYVIHCDSSKYSYLGILQQTRPGTEELVPVAYFSSIPIKTAAMECLQQLSEIWKTYADELR